MQESAGRSPSLVTITDYLVAEEHSEVRHEYLGGMIYAMAGGTNDHAAICANTVAALGARLRGRPCRPFGSDAKVRIELRDHTRFYYPDAQVVCRPNPGSDRYQENPTVIVEVLSDSTRRIDLGEKRDAYLTIPSLRVLLFVEPDQPHVTAWRRRVEGGFEVERYDALNATIDLPEIQADLPMSELYEGLSLRG